MLNITKVLIPLLVIAFSPLASLKAEAKTVAQQPCFQLNKGTIVVPRKINSKQLEILKRIKISQPNFEVLILNYSLENNIKTCLEQGKKINGFVIPQIQVKPGFVSIDSNTVYKTMNKFFVKESVNSGFTLRAKGSVDVNFSPAKGYTVSSNLIRF